MADVVNGVNNVEKVNLYDPQKVGQEDQPVEEVVVSLNGEPGEIGDSLVLGEDRKKPQNDQGNGTGHSDNLDVHRNNLVKAQNEEAQAKKNLNGKEPEFKVDEKTGYVSVAKPGDGLKYEAAMIKQIAELNKALKEAEKDRNSKKQDLDNYQNGDFKKNPDFDRLDSLDREYKEAEDKVAAIKKNISDLEGILGTEKEPAEGTIRARVAELKKELEDATNVRKDAEKKVKRTRGEGRRAANIERREADATAKTTLEEDKIKAAQKKEANRTALENGEMPMEEYSEKYVVDAAKKSLDYKVAQKGSTEANNEINKKFPELGTPAYKKAKENVEKAQEEFNEKNSAMIQARQAWKDDKSGSEALKKAYEDTLKPLKEAADKLKKAQDALKAVEEFLQTEFTYKYEYKDENGKDASITQTKTYKQWIDGVEGAKQAWEAARDAGLAKLDDTEKADIQKAEEKYNNTLKDNKEYAKEVKAQVRLLSPEVFNHKNKTKEAAEEYGKSIVKQYAPDYEGLIKVDAKKEGNSWVPVYRDLDDNEIPNMQKAILDDFEGLPRQRTKKTDEEIRNEIIQRNETALNDFDGQINNLNAQLSDGGAPSLQTVQDLKAKVAALDDEKLTPEQKAKKQELLNKLATLEASLKPADARPTTSDVAVNTDNTVTQTNTQPAAEVVNLAKYNNSDFVEQCKIETLSTAEKTKLDKFVKRVNDSEADPKKTVDMIKNSKNPNAVPIRGSVTVESAGDTYTINNAVVKGDWGLLYTVQLVVEEGKVFAKVIDIKRGPDCNAEKTYYANKDYKNKKFPLNADGTINQNAFTMLVSEKYQIGDAVQ